MLKYMSDMRFNAMSPQCAPTGKDISTLKIIQEKPSFVSSVTFLTLKSLYK